jgi:hypothetical protein
MLSCKSWLVYLPTVWVYLLLLFLQSVDIPGLGYGQSEYFPYVYYKINVDMMDTKV